MQLRVSKYLIWVVLVVSLASCSSYRWPGTSNHRTKDGKWTFNHRAGKTHTGFLGDLFTSRRTGHKSKWGKDSFTTRYKGPNTKSIGGFFTSKSKRSSTRSLPGFFSSKTKYGSTKSLGDFFSVKTNKGGKINTSCNAFMIRTKNKSKYKSTDFFSRRVKDKKGGWGKDPFSTKRAKTKSYFGKGSLFGSNGTSSWKVGKGYGKGWDWNIFHLFQRSGKKPKSKTKSDPFAYNRNQSSTKKIEKGLFPKGVMPNE